MVVVNRRGRAPSGGPLTDSYSLRTEVEDVGAVLDEFDSTRALFGWSYGGLVTLLAANERPIRQVIAYEPVMRPFGRHALPDLKAAAESADWDRCVEIVNRQISGFSATHVEHLRADHDSWTVLRRLSEPLYTELGALNATPPPDAMARLADQVDLIIGRRNRGTAPLRNVVRRRAAARRSRPDPRTPPARPPGPRPGAGRACHLLNTLAAR